MNVFLYHKTLTIRFDIVAIIFQKTICLVRAVASVCSCHSFICETFVQANSKMCIFGKIIRGCYIEAVSFALFMIDQIFADGTKRQRYAREADKSEPCSSSVLVFLVSDILHQTCLLHPSISSFNLDTLWLIKRFLFLCRLRERNSLSFKEGLFFE